MFPAHRTAPLPPPKFFGSIVFCLPICVLALICLLLPSSLSAQQASTALFSGSDPIARAVAVNPANNLVYLTYDSNNNLRVINGRTNTLLADISLGGNHNQQIAINPITNTIYVSNSSNYVSVIDGASNNVIATISVGNNPDMIAVNPVTNRVYVINTGDGNISVIDGATNCVIATIAVDSPPALLAVDSVANRVYAGSLADGTVNVIDGTTNLVTATVQTGATPFAIAVDPATDFVYVSNNGSNTVSYFSGSNPPAIASTVSGTFSSPQQLVVNPTTHTVYVANGGNQTVSYFTGAGLGAGASSAAGPAVALAIGADTTPQNLALAIDALTNTIYVGIYSPTNAAGTDQAASGNLFVIDGSTNQVKTSFGSPVAQFTAVDPATFTGISSSDVIPGVRTLYLYGAYRTVGQTQTVAGGISNSLKRGSSTSLKIASVSTFQFAVLSGTVANAPVTDSVPAPTTTSLASSPNPSSFGQSVTLTATVTSATDMVTGSVNFLDGATLLGSAIVSGDAATISTSTLAVGTHSLTAGYTGSTTFAASTSAVVTQTVDKAATTTTVVTTPNPSNFGQTVALNVTVTSAAGTPTGTVNIFNGATLIISGTLANGKASINVSSLPVETANFSAVYLGNANFATSTGTVTQIINPVPSTTTLASSLNPSTFGQSVTLTATVTSPPFTPTGAVRFFNGATLLGSGTIASGKATFSTSTLPGGPNNLTATYVGTTNLAPSTSAIFTQTVNPAPTTTTLTAAPNPSAFAQSVTFTATVTSTAGAPAGSVNFFDGATLLGSGTLSGSTATFSTSALTGGTHSLTAAYAGSANFATSTSSVVMQAVNLAATATSLTSAPNPSTFNQSVTLTATVTSTAGTPAGSVSFFDGATQIGSGTLSGGSTAFTISTLATATHSLTAAYVASINFSASTSAVITQTVNPAPTTTTLGSAPNPSSFNENVTLTATVASTGGTPTGTVNFFDGATLLGSGTLAGGAATFSTSSLATNVHSLSAAYVASSNFASSSSSAISQTVNPAATATSLTSSLNPSTFSLNVTLTATVTSLGGTPAGTVNFFDGATQIGSGTLSGGSAEFSSSTLSIGPHSLTAVYVASTDFSASTSSVLTETVNLAPTTTSLSSSPNPSAFNENVTLAASVSSTGGAPSGTVNFFDGATQLGSGILSGGLATFSTAALTAGTHNLNAIFVASGNFAASNSADVAQTVKPAATATSLTSSPNPSSFNQSVTLTAWVTSAAGMPPGTVNFFNGAALLGSGTLSGGTATFSTASLPVGTASLTATYVESTNFSTSTSSPVSQSVGAAATATSLASSLNPSTFGQNVTLTATVTSAAGTPSGSVSFFSSASGLIATVPLAGNTAVELVANLSAGQSNFTSTYSGSGNFASSTSAVLQQTVNPAPTSTNLGSSLNPSQFNQAVTFTATVASGAGTPTGSVNFIDGSTLMGTGNLSGGAASFTTSSLSAGVHNVAAVYVAAANFSASASNVVIQTVTSPAPPPNVLSMHLKSSANPSWYGESVKFIVTLTPSTAPAAAGTVTFSEGSTPIGTCNLHHGFGLVRSCAVRYSHLSMGTTAITATFNGDTTYGPQSATINQIVIADTTETFLQTSPNVSTEDREVLLTAFVVSRVEDDRDHEGDPEHDRDHDGDHDKKATGTVTFYCNGAAIGTYDLNSGEAHMKYIFSKPGTYKMTAVYSGSDSKQPSTSGVEIQTVKPHKSSGPHDRD